MRSEQKAILGETGRWLRIGTLTLTTLAPLLSTLASRLPKRAALVIDEDDVQAVRSDLDAQIEAELEKRHAQQLQQELRQYKAQHAAATSQEKLHDLVTASQGKLQMVGTALGGSFDDLKSHPYTQKLQQRSSDLTDTLKERGGDLTDTLKERASNLTHRIADRSDDFTHAIADRSDDFTHELGKRGKHVKRAVQKQNRKLQKKWQKQFQQRQQKANKSFWIALGFGFGLTIAGVITYQLLRRRLQQQSLEEETAIQVSYDTTSPTASRDGNVTDVATKSSPSYPMLQTTLASGEQKSSRSTEFSGTQAANVTSLDAAFVGVTSTKLYYPIETPLDQLSTSGSEPVDVIYFLSAQEANDRGFKPAASKSPAASSRADRSF
jgi:hypothetical protein